VQHRFVFVKGAETITVVNPKRLFSQLRSTTWIDRFAGDVNQAPQAHYF